jgi:YidC/Oxa1 family membrane protein insertase
MRKNMPAEALTGPFAQQQKMMLYLFPIIFAVGGINFPVGVLIYWFASNLWTMGQQFYVIRRNPAPGTPAYDAWEHRQLTKAKHRGKGKDLAMANVPTADSVEESSPPPPTRVVRQQPRKQTRSQRRT